MDNISYIISETVSETVSSESVITHDFDIQIYNLEEDNSIYTDTMYADTVNYADLYTLYTTYSVKSLLQIVSYYKLNCFYHML